MWHVGVGCEQAGEGGGGVASAGAEGDARGAEPRQQWRQRRPQHTRCGTQQQQQQLHHYLHTIGWTGWRGLGAHLEVVDEKPKAAAEPHAARQRQRGERAQHRPAARRPGTHYAHARTHIPNTASAIASAGTLCGVGCLASSGCIATPRGGIADAGLHDWPARLRGAAVRGACRQRRRQGRQSFHDVQERLTARAVCSECCTPPLHPLLCHSVSPLITAHQALPQVRVRCRTCTRCPCRAEGTIK